MLKQEQEEYTREGIEWVHVSKIYISIVLGVAESVTNNIYWWWVFLKIGSTSVFTGFDSVFIILSKRSVVDTFINTYLKQKYIF